MCEKQLKETKEVLDVCVEELVDNLKREKKYHLKELEDIDENYGWRLSQLVDLMKCFSKSYDDREIAKDRIEYIEQRLKQLGKEE